MAIAHVLSHRAMAHELGLLGEWLERNNFFVSRSYREDDWSLTQALDSDLLIILGSPNSVAEGYEHESSSREVELVKARIEQNKPLFGICFGAQIIGRAIGGKVKRHTTRNRSFKKVDALSPAISAGPWGFSHEDRVEASSIQSIPGVEVMATYEDAAVVFTQGCINAIQFHPEVDGPGYARMLQSVNVEEAVWGPVSEAMQNDDAQLRERTFALFDHLYQRSLSLI